MTDTISKVREFHKAFDCAIGERPFIPESHTDDVMRASFDLANARDALRAAAAKGDLVALRLALITEELVELADALDDGDLESALDALVDMRYVLDGTAIAFGFHRRNIVHGEGFMTSPFEVAFDRVHAANMRKLGSDGKPVHNAQGKVCKPPGWVAADLSDLVL